MSRSRIALAVLFFAALLVPTTPAQAAYSVLCTGYTSCEGKGYSHGGYASNKDKSYWNMYTGTNCTNYVAYRLVSTNGLPNKRPKSGVGNARDWGTAMASVTDNVPTKGSVAWWGKTGNHVAYVEKVVSSTEIWVSESNWSGAFDWRKITKSGSGWPDGFIHFSDPKIVNTAKPAVSGTPKVGQPVKAASGSWSPTGNTYTYQWLANGTTITGATAKAFTPAAAHAGAKLALRVTASRSGYPTIKVTSPAVAVQPGTLNRVGPPTISGTPKVDAPLVADPGSVVPAPSSAYQWFADDVEIAGARSATFTPGPAQAGSEISLRVRATKAGYTESTAMVRVAGTVGAGDLQSSAGPRISGTSAVGSRLTASPGTWSGVGLTFGYEWRADGVIIPGATASTYTIAPADRGRTITVKVTVRASGYVTATSVSPPTAVVLPGTFVMGSRPSVSGSPRVGVQLSASPGSWSPKADAYAVQWYAGQKAIPGATALTYRLTHRERGQQVWVRVKAGRAGFTSATADSGRTKTVAAGTITHTKKPRIVGTPVRGTVLKVDAGVHSPTHASVRYQWLRDGKKLTGATKATRKVSTNDVGHRLTVKLSFTASGYTARSITTASVGKAKTAANISTKASRPGAGRATFTLKVYAPGAAAPTGTVVVRRGNTVVATAKVKAGRATVKLRKQPTGRQTYRFTFGDTSTVVRSTHAHTLAIR